MEVRWARRCGCVRPCRPEPSTLGAGGASSASDVREPIPDVGRRRGARPSTIVQPGAAGPRSRLWPGRCVRTASHPARSRFRSSWSGPQKRRSRRRRRARLRPAPPLPSIGLVPLKQVAGRHAEPGRESAQSVRFLDQADPANRERRSPSQAPGPGARAEGQPTAHPRSHSRSEGVPPRPRWVRMGPVPHEARASPAGDARRWSRACFPCVRLRFAVLLSSTLRRPSLIDR
jgi:hypothetical protein